MLKPFPSSLRRSGGKSRSGFSLVELMVAVVAGLLVALAVVLVCAFVLRSFIAMGNYAELDRNSRNALDHISRNVRASLAVDPNYSLSTNSVHLVALDGKSFGYVWDPADRSLSYVTNSGNSSAVILTNCDILFFSFYQHNPTNNLKFVSATVTNEVKIVNVDWRCSKTIYGNKINTESVQTAQIAIRNY
jgi:Tfp pilus assembly protein PilW